MEEQEITNDFCGCRSRRNQGFCRWRSRRQLIIYVCRCRRNQEFCRLRIRRQPMIYMGAGAGETRDSVDGGAGDNQ